MIKTKEELLALIAGGEDSTVEFKLDDVRPANLAREFVAFSNLAGGVVLLGVDDAGYVAGVQRADVEEWVINICRHNCDPPIIPVITKVQVDDKRVLAVQIPRSYEVVSTQNGRYYIRVGSTVQTPTKFELARLFQRAQFVHYDQSPVYAAGLQDISLEQVNRYLARLGQIPITTSGLGVAQALINLRICVSSEGAVCPTIAGMLAFGHRPRHFLDHCGVTLARYAGSESSDQVVDSLDIAGTLDEQIEGCVGFVRRNMRVASILSDKSPMRQEFPDYPLSAAREAITNAIAHRDYTIVGARVRVRMFEQRVEFLSPGSLPNTLTLENIKTVQYARNPLVVSFLQGLGYMERRGEGILRIIRWSAENRSPPPRFELVDRNLFQVTLYRRRFDELDEN
jgi:ATP-dependent DNA helicase RecG